MILNTSFQALLRTSISLMAVAAVGGMPAMAQQAAEDDADGNGEIIVQGAIITAQGESIAQKRNADNLIDISAADSVGRFPDQNSAAALSRLPAVAVQRDQGQERYIQVRGAPNRWTSVSIDGVPMIGADEGGLTRAYRFDAVPAVILSALAINKSLTPNIQAEAIVANIDLRTFSPLEGKTGFHVQGDVGYGFMELGEGEQRQGSLRVSYSDGTFGVVAGASHYRREQVTDNREVGLYDEPSGPTDTQFGPTEIDIRQYRLVRENNGLFAAFEYAPQEGQRLYAKTIYTEFKDDEQRDQYEIRLDRALSGTRNLSGGDLVRVPIRGSFNLGNYRTRNFINTIGGDYEEDGWKVNFAANYTRTENTTYLPLVQASTATATSPSVRYDFSRPNFPIVQLFQTVPGATAGSFVRGPALANFDQTTLVNANTSPALVIPIVLQGLVDGPLSTGDPSQIWPAGLIVLGLGILEAVFIMLRRWFVLTPGTHIEARMRNGLYAKLQDLPVAFHDRWQSGQLLSRAVSDLNLIRRWLSFGLVLLIVNAITIVIGFAVLISWSLWLGLLFLVTSIPLWIYGYLFENKYSVIARRAQDQQGDLATAVEESVHGIRVLKAFGRGKHSLLKFADQAELLRATEIDKAKA
ncbi:MAG: TonB-dependent receptor plug domain-containing protein, partial [Blastomonas sp.]|nr:TonB-dependent receptor plug domain-containing protein [Blastomonas sp.]